MDFQGEALTIISMSSAGDHCTINGQTSCASASKYSLQRNKIAALRLYRIQCQSDHDFFLPSFLTGISVFKGLLPGHDSYWVGLRYYSTFTILGALGKDGIAQLNSRHNDSTVTCLKSSTAHELTSLSTLPLA